MTYDASNRKQIRVAEKAATDLDAQRIEFLRAALNTIQGRTWFYHFLADCGIFHIDPTFEPHRDYFALGMRNAGMKTFSEIKSYCPDLYILMEQQEHARLISLAAATERASGTNLGRDPQGRRPDIGDPTGLLSDDADDPTVWGDNHNGGEG